MKHIILNISSRIETSKKSREHYTCYLHIREIMSCVRSPYIHQQWFWDGLLLVSLLPTHEGTYCEPYCLSLSTSTLVKSDAQREVRFCRRITNIASLWHRLNIKRNNLWSFSFFQGKCGSKFIVAQHFRWLWSHLEGSKAKALFSSSDFKRTHYEAPGIKPRAV